MILTFVFTDIEGSTARWQRDAPAMQNAVRRHDEILRAAVAAHGGRVFKTIGDAFCAAFANAEDALAATLEAQLALAAEDFSSVDGLRVRMALHSGAVEERDDDYFGTAVNRVARLLAIGHGGQVLLSRATADLVRDCLPPQTSLRALGTYHLKDFPEGEQVHQLLAPGLAAEFAPLRSLGTLPSDLSVFDAQEFRMVTGFSGRDEELRRLDAALSGEGAIAVLQGLGGVGKSSVAREYGRRNRDRYSVAWWFNAQSEDGVIDGLLRFGAMFTPGLDQLSDRRAAAQRVVNAIMTGFDKPVLLIFDNLEEERYLRTWLPRGARALVTSRNAAWGADVDVVPLGVWPLDVAADYLVRESRRADLTDGDAGDLARALGGLPLATAHAAASLRNMRMISPRRYLERIADHLKNAPRGAEYPNSVFATFNTAIAQAEDQAPCARDVLYFAACYAPDGIPEELFFERFTDDVRLAEALGALDNLALLSFSEENRAYGIHRLVQLAARDLRGENASEWIASAVEAADAVFPQSVEFETWPACERLAAHARAALDALPAGEMSLPATTLADRVARYLGQRAQYASAEALLLQSLAIRERLLERHHPDIAEILHDLGLVYSRQRRCEESERHFLRALEIRKQALGDDHLDVASTLHNLAAVYWYEGQFAQAEDVYSEGLAIREKALGEEHPDIAASLEGLGCVYHEQGRYDEAEPAFLRALAIVEASLGTDHPRAGSLLNNLGGLYHFQLRLERAEPLFTRALKLAEDTLGPEHPTVALRLQNVAEVYYDQGRYNEAVALHLRALAIRERVFGGEHRDVAQSLNNLASSYAKLHRAEEAEAMYLRALEMRERTLGADHPDVTFSLQDLADLYESQGRTGEASPLRSRAATILENSLGADHPRTQAAREGLT